MNLWISFEEGRPTAAYAARELRHFLCRYTNVCVTEDAPADRRFVLRVDPTLPAHGYRLEGERRDGIPCVTVSGGTDSALLTGVYALLSRMGLFFTASGEFVENGLRPDAADGIRETVIPWCRLRGIRQHINFPMDISSYHPKEAQEYIRRLSRMGFNAITFHSYAGQWHGYEGKEETVLPGNFFYGQRHPLPSYGPVAAGVQGEAEYCIPEAECLLDDPRRRGEFAVRFLRHLMDTAKEAGLQVTLSVELPEEAPEVQFAMVREVLHTYPGIDVLEWITPEGGGESRAMSGREAAALARELFGEGVLEQGRLRHVGDEAPPALYGTLLSLKRAADLWQRREELFAGLPERPVQVGLYVTCRDTLRAAKAVMDRVFPPEMRYTFLPAHGAKAVADNLDYLRLAPEDLQRSMLYSWIEFDGNMYLQQNGCAGLEELIGLTRRIAAQEDSIHGICLNHWRLAENDVALAYAARALCTPLAADAYYPQYASGRGIGGEASFSEAMHGLGELDNFNRDRLFNIGFCYLGCWLNTPGLGWIRGWADADIEASIREFAKAREELEVCLCRTSRPDGIAFLRLLCSRASASIAHLHAVRCLKEICAFSDDRAPERLTPSQRRKAEEWCDRAQAFACEYLDRHMEEIPDRGCEGTAVSYCATILVYIDHIRRCFLRGESDCPHLPPSFDQPPPPDTAYL